MGKDNRPKFAAARKLLNSSGWDELKEGDIPKAHGGRTKIRVFDYDNDGRLDILLGDVKPTTYQTRPPLSKNEKKLKKKLEAELERIHDREFYDKINALNRKYWDAKNAGNKKEAGGFRAEQDKMREPAKQTLRPTPPHRLQNPRLGVVLSSTPSNHLTPQQYEDRYPDPKPNNTSSTLSLNHA